MAVEIETYLRSRTGVFIPVAQVHRHTGDPRWMEGAIEFTVDGQAVLDRALWDDVNWLWPSVIQAVDDCLAYGAGQRYFPDQPIIFRVEQAGPHRLVFRVDGGAVHRVVSADRVEVLRAIA